MTVAPPDARAGAADSRRHLPLAGTFNVRDVGGYPVSGGGTTRWRTLLRSDALHRLTDAGRGTLAQLGLRHVVDLRSSDEISRAPDALGRLGTVTTLNPVFPGTSPPVSGAVPGQDAPRQEAPSRLEDIYRYMIDECGPSLAAAVTALAGAAGTPALVHCSAGKDRTGVVTALVLEVVGVDDSHIAADFALTSHYLHADNDAAITQLTEGTGSAHVSDPALLACPPELILDTLRYLRERHGSAREYLLRHGATRAALDQLTAALVTPASSSTDNSHFQNEKG